MRLEIRLRLGLAIGKKAVEGKGSFAVEVPGSEEEGEEVSDGGTFDTEAGVFPMTVERFEVGVFVGEVDTAGVADLAVDDDDLAVVAVVMEAVDAGIELVRRGAMDADGLEVAVIAGGESEDTADIVVHDVDFDVLFDFCLEGGENLVPNASGADDDEFKEDEVFGGF